MIARNVTRETLMSAAAQIGAVLYSQSRDKRRFVLRPGDNCQFRRVSASYFSRGRRRVHAVCWHGHRDFFRAVFAQAPVAVIVTSKARYTAHNFEVTYPTTNVNIGPPIAPVMFADACDCPDSGRDR